MQISFKNRTLSFDTPKIMGILNVTPDSFSDGGKYNNADAALKHAEQMVKDGASIIDVGGESTRPGALAVSTGEELDRVVSVVEKISQNLDVMISVDTSNPEVIKESVNAGAHIWNDIRALRMKGAEAMAAKLEVPVILMHMQGDPVTMQINPHYENVVEEVYDFLAKRTADVIASGVKKENIMWDIGFGFGKTCEDNFRLLKSLERFTNPGYPLLSALSRKSMIGIATGIETPSLRVTGSVAGALISFMKGANFVRVHDVKETNDALMVYLAMNKV